MGSGFRQARSCPADFHATASVSLPVCGDVTSTQIFYSRLTSRQPAHGTCSASAGSRPDSLGMPGLSLQQNAFFSLPFLFHTSAGPRPSGVRMRSPLQDATQCSEKRKFYPQMTDQFRRVPVDLHFRIFVLCDSPRASLRSVARLHGACGRSRSAALAPALLAGDRRAQASAAPLLLWWSTLQPVRVFRRPLRDTLCVTLLGRLHARPRLPLHRASPLVSRQGFFVRWRSVFHKGLVSRPVLVCLLHGSSPFSLQLIVRVSARASGRPPVSSGDPVVPAGDTFLSGSDCRRTRSQPLLHANIS